MPLKKDDLNRSCRMHGPCHATASLLLYHGVEKPRLHLCHGKHRFPCEEFPANLKTAEESLDADSAEDILRLTEDLFAEQPEQLFDEPHPVDSEPPFLCPEIGCFVYQPCQVKSCAFWTDHPWARNCILHYIARHDRYSGRTAVLNNHDLSILLGLSPSTIRSLLTKAIVDMRHGALKAEIEKEPGANRMTRLATPDVCCVCEEPAATRFSTPDAIHYCSTTCRDKKPPLEVRVEREFSLPIQRILELCRDRFVGSAVMANALGVTPSIFLSLCAKYEVEIRE